ncbi:MAG: alpha/beta fold hydrolase [Elainellaceae cyanobacterium]
MTQSCLPDLTSNSVPLVAEIQGNGIPMLCLHGHPGSGASMSVFTQHLSQRFKTIAPDLRGYGKSRARHPFSMDDHLDDLDALCKAQHLDRCLVLGWSLGGILAIELALRYPHRVSGLILIATAARPRSNHPPVSWQDNVYTGISSILNRLNPGWQWNIDAFGKRSLYRYLIQQHTPFVYQRLAHEGLPAYLQTSQAASQALRIAIQQGYNRLPDLAAIQCPCLMLMGERDRHITAEASLETAQYLNAQWHCYPNTAHLFPWEIPHRVLTDIDDWLETHWTLDGHVRAIATD